MSIYCDEWNMSVEDIMNYSIAPVEDITKRWRLAGPLTPHQIAVLHPKDQRDYLQVWGAGVKQAVYALTGRGPNGSFTLYTPEERINYTLGEINGR